MSTMTPDIPRLASRLPERTRSLAIGVAILAALLIVAYLRMLVFTAHVLVSSDDMAQGLMAPFVALFIAWEARRKLLSGQTVGSAWGLMFLAAGAALGCWSVLAYSTTTSRTAFLFSIAGCIIIVFGFRGFRVLLFPLALLLFTFPIPPVLYGELTAPLQTLASKLSENLFELIGMTALRQGNIIQLPTQTLSIVDACSGLRSLLTLLFFTLTYVFFFEHRLLLRSIVVGLCIPAAILLNVLRITVTGILAERVNPRLAHGLPHEILGWTCFVVGVLLIVAFHRLVLRRFVPAFRGR